MHRPTRILLVEDSRTFSRMVAHSLESRLGLSVTIVVGLAEAGRYLDQTKDRPLVVTGLSLSDGHDVDVVSFFAARGQPVIVVTGMFDEALRERIMEMPVIDYVLKDHPGCIDNLVELVRRLERNRTTTALVVDDSKAMRHRAASLLSLHRFHVLEAEDGIEGLAMANAHPQIRLVVTDFDMPRMDGVEMIRRIRHTRPREELAIIGLSGSNSHSNKGSLSARFLKSGANDFLTKPFEREEFNCRVDQNMEALESYARLHAMATTDFLTGLSNRRHFFAQAEPLVAKGGPLTVAMMDIDHFKRINDSHGHDGGDAVLKEVAAALAGTLRGGDLLARLGGEEFCILAPDLPPSEAKVFFDGVRRAVAALAVDFAGQPIPVTISIGLCSDPANGLSAMMSKADEALYRAKSGGRNRVEG